MARGWESKSVEAQIETAQTRTAVTGPILTEAQIVLARKRENLLLSRTRVMRELETSSNPRYLSLLDRELKVLDEKLRQLVAG